MKISIPKKLNYEKLYILFFLFAILRPTFYMISPIISRLSDFLVIILGCGLLAFHRRLPKIKFVYAWFFLFLGIMVLTLTYNSFFYQLSMQDFVILFLPFYFLTIFLTAYNFIQLNPEKNTNKLINTVVILGLINSILSFIQYNFKESIITKAIFYMYNVPNLLESFRPGGLCYSVIEYSMISGIASFFLFSKWFLDKRNYGYLIIAFINLGLSFFSKSKAGMVFIIISLVIMMLYHLLSVGNTVKKIKTSVIVGLLIILPSFFVLQNVFASYRYLTLGFQGAMDIQNTKVKSITARVEDYDNVSKYISLDKPINFLIGYSPLRNYKRMSYIEVSAINILFRYGFLGFFIYYSFFIFPIIIARKKIKQISINPDFKVLNIVLIAIVIAVIITDFISNATETIKAQFIIISLLGALFAAKKAIKTDT